MNRAPNDANSQRVLFVKNLYVSSVDSSPSAFTHARRYVDLVETTPSLGKTCTICLESMELSDRSV